MKKIMNQNGLTYLTALALVMLMGVMLGMLGQSWKTIMQREKEKKLLFRGSQIKEAMERCYRRHPIPLNKLEELRQDPNSLTPVRDLRRPYTDPMMPDKSWPDCWTTVKGTLPISGAGLKQNILNNGIISVASSSIAPAFKVSFSEYSSLKSLGVKKSDPADPEFKERPLQYRDWQFVADPNNDHAKTYDTYHER